MSPTTICTDCTVTVGKGEIVGLTGLIGSGYEELPYLVFGARPPKSGTIAFDDGEAVAVSSLTPRKAIDLGLALCPATGRAPAASTACPSSTTCSCRTSTASSGAACCTTAA